MRVKVTQEDIDRGRPGVSSSCPIALALERETHSVWLVSNYTAEQFKGGRFRLPQSAVDFVRQFDKHHDAVPFEFEMEV